MEPGEVEEAATRFHVDQQIDVAPQARLATYYRSEDAHVRRSMPGSSRMDLRSPPPEQPRSGAASVSLLPGFGVAIVGLSHTSTRQPIRRRADHRRVVAIRRCRGPRLVGLSWAHTLLGVPEQDSVLESLLDLARERFPTAFTLDSEQTRMMGVRWFPGVGLDLRTFPAHTVFEDALASDSQLAAFAPPNEPFVSSSTGQGWRVEKGILASTLIATATSLHLAYGKATDNLDGFLAGVRDVLYTFRRLVAGQPAESRLSSASTGSRFATKLVSRPAGVRCAVHAVSRRRCACGD